MICGGTRLSTSEAYGTTVNASRCNLLVEHTHLACKWGDIGTIIYEDQLMITVGHEVCRNLALRFGLTGKFADWAFEIIFGLVNCAAKWTSIAVLTRTVNGLEIFKLKCLAE